MFCTRCGVELESRDCFCYQCGASTGRALKATGPARRLYRSVTDRKIGGVCGGLAVYADMDPTLVRLLFLLLTFGLPPAGILGYIAAWIIMPVEPYAAPNPYPAEPAATPHVS